MEKEIKKIELLNCYDEGVHGIYRIFYSAEEFIDLSSYSFSEKYPIINLVEDIHLKRNARASTDYAEPEVGKELNVYGEKFHLYLIRSLIVGGSIEF
jgi:hypothetical protein